MAQYKSNKYSKNIDESEVWGLDVVMSEFILPRIKMLRALEGVNSCVLFSARLRTENPTKKQLDRAFTTAKRRSDRVYDAIEKALQLNIDNNTRSLSAEEWKEMKKGLVLLGKFYAQLWS